VRPCLLGCRARRARGCGAQQRQPEKSPPFRGIRRFRSADGAGKLSVAVRVLPVSPPKSPSTSLRASVGSKRDLCVIRKFMQRAL
jgi:hypothetical protein